MPTASQRAAHDNPAGTANSGQPAGTDSAQLAGLILDAPRPTVSGRGRTAKPVTDELAASLTATLEGKGFLTFTGTDNERTNHKNQVNKWITANGGKAKVTVKYVTDAERTAALPEGERGTAAKPVKVTAYWAERVAQPVPAAAS